MRDLSGTTAASEKGKQAYRVVWLVEIATKLVSDGSAATLYYANREYTIDGQEYTDGLNPAGLALGWATLRERGGLAPVADMSVRIAAPGGQAATLSAYELDNSTVSVYVVFVTGAETASDKVQLQTGVIENVTWDQDAITLSCIDTSDQGWREVPTHKVTVGEFPYAPTSEYGAVVPVALGTWTGGTDDPAPQWAATRCLHLFLPAFSGGYYSHPDYDTRLVEWVEEARAVGQVKGISYYNHVFEDQPSPTDIIAPYNTAGSSRIARLTPYLPGPTLSVTGSTWQNCLDNDTTTYSTVPAGDVLDFQWACGGTIGTIAAIDFKLELYSGTGSADVTVKFGSDDLVTYTTSTDLDESLLTLLGDAMVEAWHFEQMSVIIQPSGGDSVLVARVYLEVEYAGQNASEATALRPMFLSDYAGLNSDSTHQSAVVSGTDGTTADGPVSQLLIALTDNDFFALAAGKIHTASWATAHAARDGDGTPWLTHFQLLRTVGWDFWDALCFEAGLHLFQNAAGQWQIVARDASSTPVRAFGPADIALSDPRDIASAPDVAASMTPTRDVVNEVVLRYDYDPTVERYRKVAVRTAQYRYSGHCTVDATGKTLTDASAHFSTGDYAAAVGDRIYVGGVFQFTLEVTSINSDTELGIELWSRDPGPLADVASSTAYYGGPGVSGAMVASWLRYGTVNPLQGAYDPAQDSGGYVSSFLYDDSSSTAELVLDYFEDWLSQRRMTVEFGTYLGAVDVELGDVVVFACPGLPTDRAVSTYLDGAATAGDGTVTVDASTGIAADDYLMIGSECMLVTGVAGTTISVTRAQLGTSAAAHKDNALVSAAVVKWEVTGVQTVPASGMIRLRLTEMPAA